MLTIALSWMLRGLTKRTADVRMDGPLLIILYLLTVSGDVLLVREMFQFLAQ